MAGCNLRKSGSDFNQAWGGGKWASERAYVDMTTKNLSMPEFNKRWGGENWKKQSGLGQFSNEVNAAMEEFGRNWTGDAWLKDRLGMGQFDKKSGSGAEMDEPAMPDDSGDESTVDDEVMEELTEGDPNEEAQIAAQRARRRRALMSKFNKQDTIRTSGRGAKQYA